ncbi:UDP-N-acetylmuramate--L-alanine ligase [bacterium]|nr:UDP-N-acetylmuramate--L-alanine ligase [bacterium]
MSDTKQDCDFHFIAIGGVGQSALAKILLSLGYKVTGSDLQTSKYTKQLSSLGATIYVGHNKENIKGNPKIVVSSAIKEDNPEFIEAKRKNLQIMHRSDCLKFISEQFPCFIGLSGTHGKTTTSGLLSFVLEKMNLNPSYAVGGFIPKINTNARCDKTSKYFIAELDESDGSIQKYSPNILAINNLEEDHLDYYKNGLQDIFKTFKKTIENMNDNSHIFVNLDCKGVQEFIKQNDFKNLITYSINSKSDYVAKNIQLNELHSSFDVYKKEEFLTSIKLIIPGLHNIYNALCIVSILDFLKIKNFEQYFEEFSGMARRFQIVSNKKGITIVDDYAHHPNEINSTLNAIKNLKRKKKVIFQPHRYTRLKGLWNEFLKCFSFIDELYVIDVFCAGDKFDETFNSKTFTQKIKEMGVNAHYIEGNMKEIAQKIAPQLKNGEILLTLGAGNVTEIGGYIDEILS